MLKQFIRSHARLNAVRKTARFAASIPRKDYRDVKKVSAALRVRPYTRLSYARLARIYELARTAPAGAFVECGVWNGGSAAMAALAAPGRDYWLFDSWEGLPEPGPQDVTPEGLRRRRGWNRASVERVEELMIRKLQMPSSHVHIVRGWFDETLLLSTDKIGSIAFLHLDGDWYESIRLCLEHLHPLVARNGIVVVDDYERWLGCRAAVDEFVAEHQSLKLAPPVHGATYWRNQ